VHKAFAGDYLQTICWQILKIQYLRFSNLSKCVNSSWPSTHEQQNVK